MLKSRIEAGKVKRVNRMLAKRRCRKEKESLEIDSKKRRKKEPKKLLDAVLQRGLCKLSFPVSFS